MVSQTQAHKTMIWIDCVLMANISMPEKLALKVTIVDSGEITNEKEKRKLLEADVQSKKSGLRKY